MSAPSPLILAVDDDPDLRALFAELLATEGYWVCVRATVEPPEVARLSPDLLLLDLSVDPGQGRLELVEALRADPTTARLPILLVTGAVHRVEQQASRLEALGVGVVLKPFDLQDVLDRVGARLEASEDGALSA